MSHSYFPFVLSLSKHANAAPVSFDKLRTNGSGVGKSRLGDVA